MGLDSNEWSDTDKNKDGWDDTDKDADGWDDTDKTRMRTAGTLCSRDAVLILDDKDILPEGCWESAEEDNASVAAAAHARKHSRTTPTAKRASVDSEAEPLRKRRHRCITEVAKIICRVRAGAQAMQLTRPHGESADLYRNVEAVEQLIDVRIEHPYVRSVELQNSKIVRRLLNAKTEVVIGQGTPLDVLGPGYGGRDGTGHRCVPHARDVQR